MQLLNVLLEQVKLDSIGLGIDQSVTVTCPFCQDAFIKQGRPSHVWTPTNSLSITKIREGILYNCFRASCEGGGLIPSVHIDTTETPKPKFIAKEYMHPTKVLTNEQRMYLVHTYGLVLPEIFANGIVYSPDNNGYVFPLLNENGHVTGYLNRSFSGRKPKTINYWFEDVPNLHFPDSWDKHSTGSILLVEDTLSAIIASRYTQTIALLGTNLTTRTMEKISEFSDSIILALDEDASLKALEYRKKYSILFLNFSVKLLSKDIKDMTTAELDKEFK